MKQREKNVRKFNTDNRNNAPDDYEPGVLGQCRKTSSIFLSFSNDLRIKEMRSISGEWTPRSDLRGTIHQVL
jgi:hypothetical protein